MVEAELPGWPPGPTPQQALGRRAPPCVGGVQGHPLGLVGERALCSGLASLAPSRALRGEGPLSQDVLPGWRWGHLSEPLCSPEPPLPMLRSGPSWVPGRPPAHPGVHTTIHRV